MCLLSFFFTDTPTTEIYTLSLHDALPILPPMWALGNQQSRWSYYPDTMVEEVVSEYRKRDLPLDVIYLDIDYMHGYRVFTFDKERFPDPKGLTDRLKRQGVKVVTIVDPGIKHQPNERGYQAYDEGLEKNFFQRRRNGDLFVPRVWQIGRAHV